MKKFIIQFIIFSAPIVLISYGADIFISKELKKSHHYSDGESSSWNDIYTGKVNAEIVIYGSSRAWKHFNPEMIADSLHTTAYNLGIDGHNFWLQYLRHSLLLEHNIQPKLIIHSLDIFTLQKREDLFNPDQFLPYMLFNSEIKNATIGYKGYRLPDYQIPLVRYYGNKGAMTDAVKLYKNPSSDFFIRNKGYQGEDKPWNNDFDKAKEKMKNYEAKLDSATISLFDSYLAECKTKNIKIIFVYTPEYIEGQKLIKNRAEVFAQFNRFSNKYNIPFYDFSNDSISFSKKYFYNAEHLNKTGAELLTNRIIEKLKNTNVQGILSKK
jgi:hypothetical protein